LQLLWTAVCAVIGITLNNMFVTTEMRGYILAISIILIYLLVSYFVIEKWVKSRIKQ
jgi:hypothetical protein